MHRAFFFWVGFSVFLLQGRDVPVLAHSAEATVEDVHPESAPPQPSPEQPFAESPQGPPAVMFLEPGQIRSVSADEITRVAVGDPNIADVTIVSANELLLQAKVAGTTTLILWDRRGQHISSIEVIDRSPEAMETQLRQLIGELKLPGVNVARENGKVFLTGEVARQEDVDRLEQMLVAFPGVTNLVSVPAPPLPPPPVPEPLVSLSVQVIEISRTDLEKLGVKWKESMALTEQAMPAASVGDTLFRVGQTISREGLTATLNALVQQDRARILAEPKLVTASGKQASSFIGVEVPVIQATSFGIETAGVNVSINFRQTGVLLKMTPEVLENQAIMTTVEAEVSDIDKSVGLNIPVGTQTILVPGFGVRKANTEVTTTSGETIMIAGLLKIEDTRNVSQVPALGSIPVFGRLFRSPETKSTQRELVIAVTPELLVDTELTTDKSVALEQALAVAEVTASVEDPTLRYALQVQDRIAKSLQYPLREKELGMGGQVKLRLHLFRDGSLGRALVAESSGIESLDQEALKVAETHSPYPPFPSDLLQQDLWLELPVLFRQ